MSTPEVRAGAEFRVSGRTLSGVAMKYGDVSPDYRERFLPGAFGSVDRIDVNLQHDSTIVLARDALLTDSERELRVRADLPADSAALALVRRGALNGFSVEFHARAERREAGVRVIERAALAGLALVDQGAYRGARAEIRQRSGRTLRAVIPSDTNVDCRCSGADCQLANMTGESLNAMIEEVFEREVREVIASFGSYDMPLASTSHGTIRGRMVDEGAEIEVDLPVGPEGDSVLRAHENAGIVLRPHLDPALSESTIVESAEGNVRAYTKIGVRAFVASATDARRGWPEPRIIATPEMERAAPKRRIRRWL